METIQIYLEANDLILRSPINSSINRLLSRKTSNTHAESNKDNLRHRKKTALQLKRNFKKQRINFLAKTYLDVGIRSSSYNSQRKISKRKIENERVNCVSYLKQSIDLERDEKYLLNIDNQGQSYNFNDELMYYSNNRLISKHKRKRSAQSAVSRSAAYPKLTIQVPNSDVKEVWSRKTSSTASKKVEQFSTNMVQSNTTNIETNLFVRPIKSVPFVKQPKYYSCSPQFQCLSSLMERNGFSQYKGNGIVMLKWTENQSSEEYQNVQDRQTKHYNHIKNNPLITKLGLHKVYRLLYQQNCKPYKFMPRMYTHKDSQEYIKDYEFNSVLILLDKHIDYCKTKQPVFDNLQQLHNIKKQNKGIQQLLQTFISRKGYLSQEKNKNYLVNISMCMLLLRVLQDQRCKRLDQNKSTDYKLDNREYRNLLRFSKIQNNYDQYSKHQFSNLENKFRAPFPQRQSKWQTPSPELVLKLMFYKQYFLSIYPQGWQNLWMIRSLLNKQQILTKQLITLDKDIIVWKYIENIGNFKNNSQQAKHSKNKSVICNEKVEIIQPVLIKSVEPLVSYFFSQCYYKIFSQFYDEDDQQNSFFKKEYVCQKVFEQKNLRNRSRLSMKQLKSLISTYIKAIIKISSMQMINIPGCFQIMDFHIQLNQNGHPYIVNISKSSRIQKKAPNLKQYYTGLLLSTMKTIMNKDYFKSDPLKDKYCWIQLIKQQQRDLSQKTWLQVYGKRINRNLKVGGEEFKSHQRDILKQNEFIQKIQMMFRIYLKNKDKN